MIAARSIADYYSSFKDAGAFLDAPVSWLGRISPFGRCPASDLPLILDDLRVGSMVYLDQGGLIHDPACCRDHAVVTFLETLAGIQGDTFAIRLLVFPPPVHPKVISVYPEISSRAFPDHPHLFRQAPAALPELRNVSAALRRRLCGRYLSELPKMTPDALCTYRPGDGEWSWANSDLVGFLDYAALFLAKHAIWVRTGASARAIWIGPQASHDPVEMLRELDPEGECRCGRGKPYRGCCRPMDEAYARIVASIAFPRRAARPAA